MHTWKWSLGRTALLDLRGKVDIIDGTWTETSPALTLTKASGFTNYSFLAGDTLELTGGTGATTGFFEVASKTSNNAIVLSSSIGSAADAQTDIDVLLRLPTIALPSDFRDLVGISASNSLLYGIRQTSMAEILHNRTTTFDVSSSWQFLGAINYVGDTPTAQLEVWPTPESNETGVFTMVYHSDWVRQTDDTAIVKIPTWMQSLYLQTAINFARGYVEEDEAGLDARLAQIHGGPIFRAARMRDGVTQRYYGALRGGATETHSRRSNGIRTNLLYTMVGNPS